MTMRGLICLLLLIGNSLAANNGIYSVPIQRIGGTDNIKRAVRRHAAIQRLFGEDNRLASGSQPFTDFMDSVYLGNVSIGTPPQIFSVVFDTMSSISWVTDASCGGGSGVTCQAYCGDPIYCLFNCDPSCCTNDAVKPQKSDQCKDKTLFNSTASSTYVANGQKWSENMTDGNISGFFGQDTFRLGSDSNALVIEQTTFGQASSISAMLNGRDGTMVNGFVGLASFATDGVPSVLAYANSKGLLSKPLFTVWLERKGNNAMGVPGGLITYGGEDNVNCGTFGYYSMTSSVFYQFEATAFQLGSYSISGTWQVVSDPAMPLISGPQAITDKLAAQVGATFDVNQNMYLFNCDAQFADFIVTIGTTQYPISYKQLIIIPQNNQCTFAFVPSSSGRANGGGPSWILGDPFMRQFCHAFDFGNGRIGLAKANP